VTEPHSKEESIKEYKGNEGERGGLKGGGEHRVYILLP
jgi:hypothetical protein